MVVRLTRILLGLTGDRYRARLYIPKRLYVEDLKYIGYKGGGGKF